LAFGRLNCTKFRGLVQSFPRGRHAPAPEMYLVVTGE
jgi:hypothetical protein